MSIEILRPAGTPEPTPADPVRVAVVGLGYWGPNLVRNLHEQRARGAGGSMRRREDALAKIGASLSRPSARHRAGRDPRGRRDRGGRHRHAGLTHHPIARAALEAGKHVFVEKPLAGSTSEALDLVRRADDAGRVLMPGHTFLYSPAVNCISDLLQSGELGDIYFISMSRVNLGLHQRDASVAWDLGPHDFSILRYWLGDDAAAT